jgi:pyruvate dehydrogenase E1 component alpha subunit
MGRTKLSDQVMSADHGNDDIGEEKRLALYRSQVHLREAEKRAFDLFCRTW